MYCKHCGQETEQKAEICIHCGKRLRNSFVHMLENNDLTRLRPQQTTKSPGTAAFLGFALGWVLLGPSGYAYLGQWNWFWITLAISFISYPITAFTSVVVFPFIFAFHQYQMAKELNAMLEQNKTPGPPTQAPLDTGGDPRAPHETN